MSATREVHADGWCVRLDLARQVLRLEVPEPVADWGRGRRSDETPLSPTPTLSEDDPVSAALLLLKAKQFDDGLYAAVELAAQRGAGRFAGKANLLRSLAATLAAELTLDKIGAAAAIHAACELGGLPVAAPEAITEDTRVAKAEFLRDEFASRPLGFYTWTPELSAIFRQDRFLQQPLDPDTADELADAVGRTAGASASHEACLRLNARLTNPPKGLSLRDAGKRPPFFSPSRSHEVTLFERLYEDRPVPEGFDLMGEFSRRVRSGEIDLTPGETSGWYDHQAWSLEPLLLPDRTPEAARLELGRRYRKHLEDVYRGALALARETHARQGGGGRGGYGGSRERPILVRPGLTVEPLPTLYARRAACYRFVRSVLEEAFGADALSGIHRLTPDGVRAVGLGEELAWVEELFGGASATATSELGMTPTKGDAAVARFSGWRAKRRSDTDVSRDARMMVPDFYDVVRERTKVWALLGWRTVAAVAEYRKPPTVLSVEPVQGTAAPPVEPPMVLFGSDRYELTVPVMAEVYVGRLLDRDEFRWHCDRYRTRKAILANFP